MISTSTLPCKAVRGVLLTLLVFVAVLLTSPAKTDHSNMIEENALKAAFLHHFFYLIRWPIENDGESIGFCAVGENPVTRSLQELLSLQHSKSLAVDFSFISTPKEAVRCDYVFIDSYNSNFALPVIYTTRGRPILTVSDVEGFTSAGGVIELKRDGQRITVRINVDALEMQGLSASSRLLSLSERISSKGGSREDHAVGG